MLEMSFGMIFFLKTAKKKGDKLRYLYLRITVNGLPKETSTRRRWEEARWDKKSGRAIGNKEDARTLNHFLDSLETKIHSCRTDLLNRDKTISSQTILDYVLGKVAAKSKVLEEFQAHNERIKSLVPREYASGTHERYVTARSHVKEFIFWKYNQEDIEFRELNIQFIKDYEYFLKTVRNCSHNTSLKYISNFKKIVLNAIDKEIIDKNPFANYKGRKEKISKKPLSDSELSILENHQFSTERLSTVRDIFIFQCYTGLAYIDALQLNQSAIRTGIDGRKWILSARQKTKSETSIPLLPVAITIMEKYSNHPLCIKRGSVLPVSSNQKMNEYLKEIAVLCGFNFTLNTHKARRTFASTVTLNNNVPINVVKEMLGHQSVKQTEEYALTSQATVGREMYSLEHRLAERHRIANETNETDLQKLERLENEIKAIKEKYMAPK